MLSWVPQSRYLELSSETADIVNKRLQTGIWLAGVHARVPEGSKQRWINLRAVEDWAAGRGPAHTHGAAR